MRVDLRDFKFNGNLEIDDKCQAKRPRPPSTHSIATYILTISFNK